MESILSYKKVADDDYYCILGCDESSTIEQILCEFKVRSLDCHPDKNIGDPAAVCRFQKLLRAKEVLCDPESRCLYDKWRSSGICMPFCQFQNLNKAAHTSMHWASKKNKDLMIECCSTDQQEHAEHVMQPTVPLKKCVWEKEKGNALLERFRNYEL